MVGGLPSVVAATHEADHRFTVEGFVCGTDGKGSANIDVLVKDTRISYGQIVKTDGEGYYKAAFHLHNDNLGDSLLIEARGSSRNRKSRLIQRTWSQSEESGSILEAAAYTTGTVLLSGSISAWEP